MQYTTKEYLDKLTQKIISWIRQGAVPIQIIERLTPKQLEFLKTQNIDIYDLQHIVLDNNFSTIRAIIAATQARGIRRTKEQEDNLTNLTANFQPIASSNNISQQEKKFIFTEKQQLIDSLERVLFLLGANNVRTIENKKTSQAITFNINNRNWLLTLAPYIESKGV